MNKGNPNKKLQAGFTLLEVLVAFSLLSVSLGVIMLGVSKSLKASEFTRDYTTAMLLAETKISEYSQMELPETTRVIGRFDNRYHWEVMLQDHEQSDATGSGLLRAYKVTVTVTWPGQNKPRELVLSTIRLGPPGS